MAIPRLTCVTITGADESIQPTELIALTEQYPFVEWGILVSQKNAGRPRFPSRFWIDCLKLLTRVPHQLPLALHLCGNYVRQALLGNDILPDGILRGFRRVQLNFHAEEAPLDADKCSQLLFEWRKRYYIEQVIFQIDGSNGLEYLNKVSRRYDPDFWFVECVPLFDLSGGVGVLPSQWPAPCVFDDESEEPVDHGYAGGLGPHNIAAQLPLITKAASAPNYAAEFEPEIAAEMPADQPARFWIDMETHVRSDNDRKFDLGKVARVLEICAPFVDNSGKSDRRKAGRA